MGGRRFVLRATLIVVSADASLAVEWLGCISYGDALARQQALVEARRAGRSGDCLLLLEHPPVITLGRSAQAGHMRTPAAALRSRGIEVHEARRGGDVTYHGPGQLVGYLIADLAARGARDLHAWLRRMEAALMDALAALGVSGRRVEGLTGVFAGDPGAGPPRKIASIGIGLRRWISYHGFALNATLDLAGFDDIVPCGLHGVSMTSVARELGIEPTPLLFARCRAAVGDSFCRALA